MKYNPHLSDAEAKVILQHMRWQAGTLFRALDRDGDGKLSPEEIANAPEILKGLDADGDGYLNEGDFGGPTDIPYMIRRSGIVKVLDLDGDMVIGPDDIAAAAERILELDTDQDGFVTASDDLPPAGVGFDRRMPMGTAAQMLHYQRKIFYREPDISGPLPPAGRSNVQPGYLLIHEVGDRGDMQKSRRTFLLDEHGQVAHEWPAEDRHPEATVAYLQPDGNMFKSTCKHSWLVMDGQFPIGSNGWISLFAPDGKVLWQWKHFEFGKEVLHHDFEVMPNGNILAICYQVLASEEARAMGWEQQGTRPTISIEKLYEIQPDLETGETKVVWEWSVADHLVQDRNPSLSTYGDPKNHPEKIDLNYLKLNEMSFNSGQMFHMNALSYNADDDIILVSCAIWGEIWAIDHSTTTDEAKGSTGGRYGRGGDLIWRFGNPRTHGAGTPAHQELFWQHDVHFIQDGRPRSGEVLIFNNGMSRTAEGKLDLDQICMGMITGAYTEILELNLPRNSEGLLVPGQDADITWSFNSDGKKEFYSPFMSGTQRMPNGNTLMCQACDKRIVEVTPEGDIVMDFHLGGPGRLYRIYKFAPDDPAILALGL